MVSDMKKLLLFGNNSEKSALMKILHKMGCVEVSLAKKLDNTQYVVDENKINEYTRKLTQLEFLFDFLADADKIVAKYAKERNVDFKPVRTSGLLIPKMSLTFDEFAKSKDVENEVFEIVNRLEKYSEKIIELKSENTKYSSIIAQLTPYKAVTAKLNSFKSTKNVIIALGTIPQASLNQVAVLEEKGAYVEVFKDEKAINIAVMYLRSSEEDIQAVLAQMDFAVCSLNFDGYASDIINDAQRSIKKNEEEILGAREMANDSDPDISEMGKEEIKRLDEEQSKLEDELREMLLPKDPNDDKNIIVEIRGAVGGDEANIFAGDLFRMYTRYAETQGWKIKMLDENPSEAGGFALVSFKITGKSVYSKLKFESGAHRVQRVPRTEASGRIHTSTATVLVMPEAEEIDIEINPNDLQVDTYHSQGAGGQNVNKTESAVRITHIPTGTVVACQTEKSQIQNREIAMQMLRTKMYADKLAKQQEEIGNERRLKVGTGERSEKIRTYNYPQNRVTDHRIGFTVQKLDRIIEGELDEVIDALIHYDQTMKMNG